MKITVNGKEFTDGFEPDGTPRFLENKPRLKWSEIGRLGGLYLGPNLKHPQLVTNRMTVRVTIPGVDKPKDHLHGHSLVLVDGMAITARP